MNEKRILILHSERDRARVKNALKRAGKKVLQESGGCVLVVEIDEGDRVLKQLSPRLRSITSGATPKLERVQLAEEDELFIKAVEKRHSRAYRSMKAKRVVGESEEEKLLFSSPCPHEH